jgi:hypothetical protein
VNDVLDFRKLDANAFKMSPKEVNLVALIDTVCWFCRSFLKPTAVLRYRVINRSGNPNIMLDPRRVCQIIANGLRCARVGACSIGFFSTSWLFPPFALLGARRRAPCLMC